MKYKNLKRLREEIKFWKKAKSILVRGYGVNEKPHKGGISWTCAECRASIGVAVIDEHIDLLKWSMKNR